MPNYRCAALDPNHSHFLLVDDGTKGEFGREIETRVAIEDRICGEASLEWGNLQAIAALVPFVFVLGSAR